MAISFNLVPVNIRVPGVYVEIDNTRAVRGLQRYLTRILVIGQKLSTGTVSANNLTLVSSEAQAKSFFGKGSILANQFKAIKRNNKYIETWAIALDDNTEGVAATGTITVTGTPTESGTLQLYVDGVRVQVQVLTSHTANNIASNIAAKINELVDLPCAASVSTNVVTLTYRHKGTVGNDMDIRLNYYGAAGGEKTPAGITVTIAAMSGGTGDPDVANAIAALPDEIFDYWTCPYTDSANLVALETELTSRWGPLRMLEGHLFVAKKGNLSALNTFGNGRNSPHVSALGVYDSPTPPHEWAAALCTQTGFAATNDPARPFQTLPLVGVLAPPLASRFSMEERNTLLYDGITTFDVARDGSVALERVITMYQLNSVSAPDPSYLDYTTMATLAYLRQTLRDRVRLKFPRFKIADDGTRFGGGQATVTPKIIKAEVLSLFTDWEELGLVENFDQFQAELIVERNASDPNRVDLRVPPDLVNGLMVVAAQIQYLL